MTPAERRRTFFVCVALIAANLIVYAPLRHYGFVDYNDPRYVYENSVVSRGLTWDGIVWALTTVQDGNWFPLTWMSHMVDVQMYGLNAGRHHVTNIVLHIASTLLLFGVLFRMTKAIGPSTFVAALFSLHPLQVESVAWIAERKTVLGTLFWMLTLYAYVAYARGPRLRGYLLVLLLYALGLMARPMLIVLPFTLLLLDVWPLGRVPIGADAANELESPPEKNRAAVIRDLLWEKVPLFSLALTSSIVTLAAQRRVRIPLEAFPFTRRLANAVMSYAAYIGKMVWPERLGVFYAYPGSLSAWKVAGAAVVLCVISVVVLQQGRRRPYLLVGWLWYLGTLLPVIGLVQLGNEAMADRYVYVPLIGLSIAMAWAARDLIMQSRVRREALAAVAFVVVVACGVSARHQVGYWQSNASLWQRARDVSPESHVVAMNVGRLYAIEGKLDEAVAHLTEASRMAPGSPEIHYELATALARKGQLDAAALEYAEALRIRPRYAEAHTNLATALAKQGKIDEAIAHYMDALRIRPDPRAQYTVGLLLRREGRLEEAEKHFQAVLRIQPDHGGARRALDRLPDSATRAPATTGSKH